MSEVNINLQEAVKIRNAMSDYRDTVYINMIRRIKERNNEILEEDLGSQFIKNCGRDIAGEVVRNFFDTSSYNITVDQLATRILKFSYENEYDPLSQNGGIGDIKKSVYNFNEINSKELDKISEQMDKFQEKLFVEERAIDKSTKKAQEKYQKNITNPDGSKYDELTGRPGTSSTYTNPKTGQKHEKTELQADHIQAREAARYNSKYITHEGVQELREFYNSSDNFQAIHGSANSSKGDIRVCNVNGKIKYVNARSNEYDEKTDITHKATPQQLADAACSQWESGDPNSDKIKKLLDVGYLQKNEDGSLTVPKSVRKALEHNIRRSQNAESVVVLKNTKYGEVAKDAAKYAKDDIGKIIAGQIIYYAAPPIVYEVHTILQEHSTKLEEALERLSNAGRRIGEYVLSKLKDIFSNILFNSLKKFIKSFMDILINTVKATIKKLLKITKNLVLSTVDAVRIIADKNASPAEKADSVFNLFGVTITSCVIEVLFELAAETLHISEPFDDIVFGPLQILATIICTNLTMLIMQKADLFDVRLGYKIDAIKKVFDEEKSSYHEQVEAAEKKTEEEITILIENARYECNAIYEELSTMDVKNQSVRKNLEKISTMFNMNIDFESNWLTYLGIVTI